MNTVDLGAQRAALGDLARGQRLTNLGFHQDVAFRGRWQVVCKDRHGREKWSEDITNKIPTAGLNHILSIVLAAGTQITAWYVGLKDSGSVVAGDTLASHGGWTEDANYSGNRKAFTPGAAAAGSIDNSASKASFAITGTTTLYGAFLASAASGSSGTLLAAVDFSSSRAVVSGDTVTVQYTLTATSSN